MNAGPPLQKSWRPTKIMLWYDSIIDWMLLNPGGSKKDCATALGRSPQIICEVTNSDLFKARYEFRKHEHTVELANGTRAKLGRVADKALDVLLDKLEHKTAGVGIATISEIADSALQRLGYGLPPVQGAQQPAATTVVVQVSPTVLREAQESLRAVERNRMAEGPSSRPGIDRTPCGDTTQDVGSPELELGSTEFKEVPP